jgi:hypothetical protein
MVRIKVDAILVSQTILPLMENGILGVTMPGFPARPTRALGSGHLIRRDCHRQVAQEEREGGVVRANQRHSVAIKSSSPLTDP